MDAELKSLQIDRSKRRSSGAPKWATRWILIGVTLFVLAGVGRYVWARIDDAPVVAVTRVSAVAAGGAPLEGVILNATGYIIAAHKIQVASKVVGKVAWIGVDKGDKVREGQTLVRLEDDEYRAQVQQAKGQLANLDARLAELVNGSRPEEIANALATVQAGKADLVKAQIDFDRAKTLSAEGVWSKAQLDEARARYDAQAARVNALEKTYELVKLGPRIEQINAVRGQIQEAKGALAFNETQLSNTVIKAPVTGTILERAVEKGEFVTTSFVGERGAKGYVVSLADLNDLQVELDISQNDFAKLGSKQRGIITTDAFPDRRYKGVIDEISPEANRQKATVQVKVKVLEPDDYLRPEMNANVAFVADAPVPGAKQDTARPTVIVPTSAVREGTVFVVLGGKAVARPVKVGSTTNAGLRIDEGLIGGEDVITSPPAGLKNGDKVKVQ